MVAKRPHYGQLSEKDYCEKINSPSRNPDYFEQFHKPIIEEAKLASDSGKVTVLDIGCGHGHELDFIKDDPDIRIVGVDLSRSTLVESTRHRLNGAINENGDKIMESQSDVILVPGDIEKLRLPRNFADMGMAVNAMVYKPDHLLKAFYNSLKPGAKAIANFRIFLNPRNRPFYNYYLERGARIGDSSLAIDRNDVLPLKEVDYSDCEDEKIRGLGKQIYFKSKAQVFRLIDEMGFEVIDCSPFRFSSVANPENEIEVFTIRKTDIDKL